MKITGSDVTEIKPSGGVIHVGGIIKTPQDKIRIKWEINGSMGSAECEAWLGQHQIDCLANAGYQVKSVGLV